MPEGTKSPPVTPLATPPGLAEENGAGGPVGAGQAPTKAPPEIVVVDDASTDETPRMLREYADRVRVVTREANGGFAAACNDGEQLVLQPNGGSKRYTTRLLFLMSNLEHVNRIND